MIPDTVADTVALLASKVTLSPARRLQELSLGDGRAETRTPASTTVSTRPPGGCWRSSSGLYACGMRPWRWRRATSRIRTSSSRICARSARRCSSGADRSGCQPRARAPEPDAARAPRRRDPRRLCAGAPRAAPRSDRRGRRQPARHAARPARACRWGCAGRGPPARPRGHATARARSRRHALPGPFARPDQAARQARHPGQARDRRARGAGLPRARVGRVRRRPRALRRRRIVRAARRAVDGRDRDRLRAGHRVADAARAACWSERTTHRPRARRLGERGSEAALAGVLAAPVRRLSARRQPRLQDRDRSAGGLPDLGARVRQAPALTRRSAAAVRSGGAP